MPYHRKLVTEEDTTAVLHPQTSIAALIVKRIFLLQERELRVEVLSGVRTG